MHLFLDIETLPADWTDEQKDAAAREAVPATHKKPETIDKWIAENRDEVHRKSAIDWRTCRVLCIGYAVDDDEPRCIYSETANPGAILDELDALLMRLGRPPVWVGHSIAGFDIPRLRLMAARDGHDVLRRIPSAKWSKRIVDTQDRINGSDPRALGHVRLADVAAYLGVQVKSDGMGGDKVYDAWLAGEHNKIRRYCMEDVDATREVFYRLPEVA